jgi:hypothetical protein
MSDLPPIPNEVHEEVGKLCIAWAFLELETERTIWAILDVDARIGPLLTWRRDIRSRWEMILSYAPKKHPQEDIQFLKTINKSLIDISRDRNIAVHGTAHYDREKQTQCWTVWRGVEAGKTFPISATAVRIIRSNINKLSSALVQVNDRHSYLVCSDPEENIEADWPKPIP